MEREHRSDRFTALEDQYAGYEVYDRNGDRDITPEYEEQVYSHYGLQREQTGGERGSYGEYYADGQRGHVEHDRDRRDEDELRVQRTEEELRAGTREREAGAINVRKRVRTDREQVRVPTRHEEVSVERVPVEGREA